MTGKGRLLLLLFIVYCYQEESNTESLTLGKIIINITSVGYCVLNFYSERAMG